jgi:hypothetical protein
VHNAGYQENFFHFSKPWYLKNNGAKYLLTDHSQNSHLQYPPHVVQGCFFLKIFHAARKSTSVPINILNNEFKMIAWYLQTNFINSDVKSWQRNDLSIAAARTTKFNYSLPFSSQWSLYQHYQFPISHILNIVSCFTSSAPPCGFRFFKQV